MRWLLVGIVPLLAHCASAPRLDGIEHSYALPPAQSAKLDQLIGQRVASEPGRSAAQLVQADALAFAYRAASAAAAERSLDVQYYLWHDDLTGKLLASELLRAADRGVRVRLLVDDLDARTRHDLLVLGDLHPNIEVRVFNPFYRRYGSFAQALEFALRGTRLNRRMHNKAWIADNRIAVVGGRNIGDEYFGVSDHSNFTDTDVVLAGPVVEQVSSAFDAYWNSPYAVPVSRFETPEPRPGELDELRKASLEFEREAGEAPRITALRDPGRRAELLAAAPPLIPVRDIRVLADDPTKIDSGETGLAASRVLQGLVEVMREADQEAQIFSPYFVPGEQGAEGIEAAARRGLRIEVLTNSLSATDVAAVHVGYARYRKTLLESGVQLYEMKRTTDDGGDERHLSLLGSSQVTLHTKALVVDGHWAFVGSMNLDPRSANLNTELGVLMDSPELAQQLSEQFREHISPELSYRVVYDPQRGLVWRDTVDGKERELEHEPDVGVGRRIAVTLMQMLPIESLL